MQGLSSATSHSNPPSEDITSSTPSITVLLTILLLVFFFFGFFTLYFCKCFMENVLTVLNRSPSGHLVGAPLPPKEGLDNALIDSFPTFIYATVKDFRIEKYGLECAICLVEFEDESMLRLLTACCHVFHQECIDLWLESHKTCPFCRRNLEASSVSDKSPMALAHHDVIHEINESHNDDDHEEEIRIDIEEANHISDHRKNVMLNNIDAENEKERFSRSHSTGHSIVRPRLQADRFTLRLPESVKIRLLRGHNATGSSTTFGEFSRQKGSSKGGFGEVSEHGSRSGRGEISKS